MYLLCTYLGQVSVTVFLRRFIEHQFDVEFFSWMSKILTIFIKNMSSKFHKSKQTNLFRKSTVGTFGTVPVSSVVDPKLFFSDPDRTFQEISDPDQDFKKKPQHKFLF